jgi:crotonobetainyl-CoA:carnitine CoA-transferase CaiB-like acyl-CoA transferase
VLAAFETAEAAIAPIYDASDVLADPQLDAIGAILSIDDAELGPIKMPSVVSRLSVTPGEVRHSGGRHGEDTASVFAELGIGPEELARLRAEGVV